MIITDTPYSFLDHQALSDRQLSRLRGAFLKGYYDVSSFQGHVSAHQSWYCGNGLLCALVPTARESGKLGDCSVSPKYKG
jgi:hypothetical protein